MAVSKGRESTSAGEVKRYIGVASVKIVALNPNKKELEALGIHRDEEPEYITTTTVKDSKGNDKEVPQVRLTFWVKTDPEEKCNNGIEAMFPITIFLSKEYRYSNKNGVLKAQVIDKYGLTAWATADEIKNKQIPQYASGPANITKDYRMAFIGEEELSGENKGLIPCLLSFNRPLEWNNEVGKYTMKKDLSNCDEALLDRIADCFKGDLSELKEILTYQPNNTFKVVLGVRTNDKGAVYQTAYTRAFLKNNVEDYRHIEREFNENPRNNTEYEISSLHEYVVTPTDYSKTAPTEDAPFPAASDDDMPFQTDF